MSTAPQTNSSRKRVRWTMASNAANGTQSSQNNTSSNPTQPLSNTQPTSSTQNAGNQHDSPEAGVFYNPVALVPGCIQKHRVYRSKRKENQPFALAAGQRCNEKDKSCQESVIIPRHIGVQSYQQQMSRLEREIERWIITPHYIRFNDGKWGCSAHRIAYLRNQAITDQHILNGIAFALEQIRYQSIHNDYLTDYLARPPYNVKMKVRVSADYLTMEPEHFIGAPRAGLEDDLRGMADEVCELRELEDELIARIEEAKMEVVCGDHDAGEAKQLYQRGLIDQKWMWEMCKALLWEE